MTPPNPQFPIEPKLQIVRSIPIETHGIPICFALTVVFAFAAIFLLPSSLLSAVVVFSFAAAAIAFCRYIAFAVVCFLLSS
jgi:hypothetical protein